MEVLNNIWMVLSTPNELNTQIITFPLTFLEIYLAMSLFLTILNISTNKKNKAIYVIISSLITIVSNFLIPAPFYVFIYNLASFILIIIIFKITPFKALISLVSYISIFGVISTLILNPYITIFNITTEELSTIPLFNIGYLIVSYIIDFILILILKARNIKINILEDIDTRNKNIILANFIFGIFTLIIQACITFYYVDNLPIIITFLSFISIFAYFSVSLYSITSVTKLTLTTQKLESAKAYNKSLHILHDNVRGFKHDFDNIVTTIGGYVRTNDMEGLKNYYIQLEDDCQRVNNLYLLNPEVINNPRNLQSTY